MTCCQRFSGPARDAIDGLGERVYGDQPVAIRMPRNGPFLTPNRCPVLSRICPRGDKIMSFRDLS